MINIRHFSVSAVLAVCLLAFTGCKTKSAPVNDATLNAALQSRLQSDPGLSGQQIQGSVQNGVVTLSGSVSNEAARSLAANDSAQIAGVRTVENNLTVSVPAVVATGFVAPKQQQIQPAQQPPALRPKRVQPPSAATYYPPVQPPSPIERREPVIASAPPAPQPIPNSTPREFQNVTVPAGTGLSVRITQTLDSETAQPGSTFSGVLASDVIVDGLVAFPTGSRVNGHVDDAKDAGHFSGSSLLSVSLSGISRRGENIGISTDTFTKQGKGRGKNTAEKIGGGAAVGAILGGIFGGGKGAAIGAGAGGGLGAGANGVTRGEQVQIPSESLVRFRLTSPVTVKASTQSEVDGGSDLRRHEP